jgi:hypothetical protein
MPKIKLTQEHVEQSTNVYDEGWYTILFDDLTEKKDSDGADLYVYTGKITAADNEASKGFVGKKVFINVSEKGFGFAIPLWRAAGASVPDKIPESGLELELGFMKGRSVKAHNAPGIIKTKKNPAGKMGNNWDMFAPVA